MLKNYLKKNQRQYSKANICLKDKDIEFGS